MATNIAIDDKLLEEACAVGKHETHEAAVNAALTEYVQRRKQAEIVDIFNSIEYESGWDYKAQRNKNIHRPRE